MTPDTHLPDVAFRPSLGYRRKAYEPRLRKPAAIVVHTTGAGPVNRVHAEKFKRWRRRTGITDPFEAALWVYANMRAGPHYVIGQEGHIAQVCPEDLCAWHVGGKHGRTYDGVQWFGRQQRYQWWFERWRGHTSPKDLAGGKLWTQYGAQTGLRVAWAARGGSVNANTIGIEVVPPDPDTRGPWSVAAWESLSNLTSEICMRRNIAATRDTIITHSDANPIARTTPGGSPWDTPETQFTWEEFRRRSGAPF